MHQNFDQQKSNSDKTDIKFSNFDQISHTDGVLSVDQNAVVRFSISALVFKIFAACDRWVHGTHQNFDENKQISD